MAPPSEWRALAAFQRAVLRRLSQFTSRSGWFTVVPIHEPQRSCGSLLALRWTVKNRADKKSCRRAIRSASGHPSRIRMPGIMDTTVSAPASTLSERPAIGVSAPTRITSIDAFRGFVMFLMLAEAMRLWTLHRAFPASRFWSIVAYNTSHVPWQGCSLHDLIQPAFSFLVGAALPFSMASRRARGESFGRMLGHAIWRSVALILLGIFLRSLERPQTYWTFEDTLTQIGLGYTFLFLLAFASLRVQVAVFTAILVGFWGAFVLYPLPGPASTTRRSASRPDWPHLYTGFLAHFNKNSNLSWAFDVWFLNLFPRETPFRFNGGGWSTLSFIPTLATMLLGRVGGRWLKTPRSTVEKLKGLVVAGVALTLAGLCCSGCTSARS